MLGCSTLSFGDWPQKRTGPKSVVLKMLSSSSPSLDAEELSAAMSTSALSWSMSPPALLGRLLRMSMSASLVAGIDDGGLEELRFGVRSGTEETDEDIDGSEEIGETCMGEEGVSLVVAVDDVDGGGA